MPKLIIPVGIPGSGKTTYGKLTGATVISSDDIRKELLEQTITARSERGEDISSCQYPTAIWDIIDNAEVERIMDLRTTEALKRGEDVYYDATNLTKGTRKLILYRHKMARGNEAVVFKTPVSECRRRNSERECVVPGKVIGKMYGKLEYPTEDEGFAYIRYIRPDHLKTLMADASDSYKEGKVSSSNKPE